MKGGEADLMTVSKSILYDWQRGEIPYYNLPEGMTEEDVERAEREGDDEESEEGVVNEDEMDVE